MIVEIALASLAGGLLALVSTMIYLVVRSFGQTRDALVREANIGGELKLQQQTNETDKATITRLAGELKSLRGETDDLEKEETDAIAKPVATGGGLDELRGGTAKGGPAAAVAVPGQAGQADAGGRDAKH